MKRLHAALFALAAAGVIAVIAVGMAGAGTPLPGKQHYMSFGPFCIDKHTGVMRAPQHTQSCYASEVRVRHLRIPLAGPTGVQGPVGVQGPQGIQGVKGDTGAQGPVGPKGDTGATGATGATGTSVTASEVPKGPTCQEGGIAVTDATGTLYLCNGIRGPQGAIGPAGPQGIQGETGAKGDTGAQGIQGVKGDTGPQGAVGPQGPPGSKGDTGAQGPPGPAGANGSMIISVSGGTATGDKQFTVSCPANYVAISGGYKIQGSVTGSYRSDASGNPDGNTSWTVIQSSGAALSGTAYVYCMPTS